VDNTVSKTTKCDHCFLIFKQGEKTCRRCQRPTVVLGSINSPHIGDPEYTDWYYDDDFLQDMKFTREQVEPIELPKSPEEIAKDTLDLIRRRQAEDPLRAEDPYLLNHHPFKKGGPHSGPKKTGL